MDDLHIEAPDGSVVQFPAGTSDDVIKGVMAKHFGAPKATDEKPTEPGIGDRLRHAGSAIDDSVRAIANGIPFMDRIAAAGGAATGIGGTFGDYSGNLARQRAEDERLQKEAPAANTLAHLAGGALTVPLGAGVMGPAAEGTGLLAKTLMSGATGAGIGAVQGASDAPDLTNLPDVAKKSGFGAAGGLVLGGVLPSVGVGIGKGYNALADALMNPRDMSRPAAKELAAALSADTPAAVQSRVAQLGPDGMLADAGPALLGKAQGASLNSDQGRSIMASALTGRNEATNQRVMGDVERVMGPAEDPQTVSDAILAHRSAVDGKNYPAALNSAPPVQTADILAQIENHIPKTVGMERKALENLRDMISTPGEKAAASVNPAVSAAPASPSASDKLAADVAAIRAKYGDAAAAAYQRQEQAASQSEPSLLEFLASKGGLGPDSELQAIGAHGHVVNVEGAGRRRLVKQGGLPLDYAREAAEEAGYLRGQNGATSTPRDFLDAIDAEIRGQKRYPEGYEGLETKRESVARTEREQHEHDAHMRGLGDDLDAAGHRDLAPEVRQRAMNLMSSQGLDADSAVERAFSHLEQEDSAVHAAGFPGDRQAPTGTVAPQKNGAARVPKDDAEVLHKIKQELDNVIEYDAPGLGVPAGAVKNQQGALKLYRRQINGALENQVPGYAAANRESAALAKRAEAVKSGTQYLGSGKTTPSPDRFAAEFDPLSQGEKIAFAKGSRGNVDRILGTKANDLQALRGELQGEGGWNTAKIATVHGRDAANELASSVDRNLKFRDTHNKVVENSQTAQRTAAANAMKPEPVGEMPLVNPNMTATGFGMTVLKKGLNAAYRGFKSDPTAHYGEIAQILSAQGSERDRYLRNLVDALGKYDRNAATAPVIGNRAALGAALLADGYLRDRTTTQTR